MSMPTSAIAATAAGFTSSPGSEPPDHATARSPARCSNQPSAICDRPALCTQRNSTMGRPSCALPSTRASAFSRCRAKRSAMTGRKVERGGASGELVVARREEQLDGLDAEDAVELLREPPRGGSEREVLVDGRVHGRASVSPPFMCSRRGERAAVGGNVREQEHGEADGEQAADELRDDERGHAARRDAGEGVGERSADRDRGVGEARRRREPVRGGDVAADRERDDARAPRAHDAEDHEQQPEGGDDLAEPQRRGGARVGRERHRGEVEHQVRDHRARRTPPTTCATT